MKTTIKLWIILFSLAKAAAAAQGANTGDAESLPKQAAAFLKKSFENHPREETNNSSLYLVVVISGGGQTPEAVELSKVHIDGVSGSIKSGKSEKDFACLLDLTFAEKKSGQLLQIDGHMKYDLHFSGGFKSHGNGISGVGFDGRLDSLEIERGNPICIGSHSETDPKKNGSAVVDLSIFLIWK